MQKIFQKTPLYQALPRQQFFHPSSKETVAQQMCIRDSL